MISISFLCLAMFYMPLLHAEDKLLSKKSLELYKDLYENSKGTPSGNSIWFLIKYINLNKELILERFKKVSIRHDDTIQQFGRYPERNYVKFWILKYLLIL